MFTLNADFDTLKTGTEKIGLCNTTQLLGKDVFGISSLRTANK